MNTVNDKEYCIAYNCVDNKKIMNFAAKPFIRLIDDDELERCKMIGLWIALQTYNKRKKTKFTSYLKSRVRWECLHYLISNKSMISLNKMKELSVGDGIDKIDLKEAISNLSNEAQKLIYQRFTTGLTFKQMGRLNGYSHETARKKLKKILTELRQIM